MSIQPDGASRPVETDEWNDCEPPEFGGARRDRTDDLKLAKLALSQLSYGPDRKTRSPEQTLVGPGRFELPTPRLSSVCSNQLSYGPIPAAVAVTGLAIPLPFPGRLLERPRRARGSRKRNEDGDETAICFCRDVQPGSEDQIG